MPDTIIFGAGSLVLTPTLNGDGTAVAVPTPVRMRELQNISGLDFKYDAKSAHGSGQFPLYTAFGKATCGFSCEALALTAKQLNTVHGQTITNGREVLYEDKTGSAVPTTPFTQTVTPPGSGTWVADMGVYNGVTGDELTRVASAPATGQYSVTAGVYTFAAADVGVVMYKDYLYSIATGKKLTINSQSQGYTPFYSAVLKVAYQGDGLLINFNRVVVTEVGMGTKQADFEMTKYKFEVMAHPITKLLGTISLQG